MVLVVEPMRMLARGGREVTGAAGPMSTGPLRPRVCGCAFVYDSCHAWMEKERTKSALQLRRRLCSCRRRGELEGR